MDRSLILHIHKWLECGGGSTVPSCFPSLSLFNRSLIYASPSAYISSVVWTLMKCSHSILILSSAKFPSKIQCRNTNILPGFDNYKITTRKKKHIKKAIFPFFYFVFLLNWRYNPLTTERVRSCFSTKQNVASSFWWPLGSLSLISKRNLTIAVLHYQVMNTSKLVNQKLQLFLCLSENKI